MIESLRRWPVVAILVASLAVPNLALGEPPASATPEPTVDPDARSLLEAGDLSGARDLAVAQRKAEPTVANFELEADAHAALGDLVRTEQALRGALERVPESDPAKRDELAARLESVREARRGSVDDEGESTHRERLDAERSERIAALRPPVDPPPVDAPPARVPIVKKWYFWVTLTTIVGAAVAITAVGIDANTDGGSSSARQPGPSTPSAGGLTLLRF